jgi:hypothetical protein
VKSVDKQTYLYDRTFFWFAASFLILFFASKSLGLTLGYALDDYATLAAVNGHLQGFLFSQGRFTFAVLQAVLDFSDLKQPELAGLGFFLSAGGLLLVCWVTLATWLQKHRLLAIAVGALLGAHPFFAEYVSFRQALFPMGVCFALIAGATILLIQEKAPATISRLCAAAGLAAVASGINQIAMAFFCIAALGISLQKSINLPPFRAVLLAVKSTALLGGLASIFYLAILGITIHMVAVNLNTRVSVLGSSEVSGRARDVAVLLVSVFGGKHPLVGPLAAICTVIAIIALGVRASTRPGQWAYVLVGAFVIGLGIATALVPAALIEVWWPMPRTLIALPLAVTLGIAILSFGASRIQVQAASGALFIAVAIFAGKSGSLLMDQQRLNRWDIGLAREILLKIAEGRQIDALTPIVIHRAKWAYDIDQGMPIGDANTSALSVGWAVDALFEEASGRRLKITLETQPDKICTNVPVFPNEGSILEVNKTIHVCL